MSEAPITLLNLIARRHKLLKSISDQRKDKRILEEELDVSRATIDRSINELEEIGCIINVDGGWQLTLSGRLALEEFLQAKCFYNNVNKYSELLNELPNNSPLSPDILYDCEVIFANQPAPHRLIKMFEDRITKHQQVMGVLPVILPELVNIITDQVKRRGIGVNIIINQSLKDYIHEMYSKEIEVINNSENTTVKYSEEIPSFSLFVLDQSEIWIGIFGDEGSLKGAFICDSKDTIRWAEYTINLY